MSNDHFFVSTIVPAYNAQEFLAEAISSVQQQAFRPLEIIVVDDGSTDGTAQVAASFGDDLRYVFQPNKGVSSARNRGLSLARGNVIAFLDADDLWPPDKLAIQLAYLAQNPQVQIARGLVQCLLRDPESEAKPSFEAFAEPYIAVNLGCALYRRSVFDQVGYFDETMQHSEDVDWLLRARECGISMGSVQQVTLLYRLHQHNMTRHKRKRDRYFALALKKSLDRRRQQQNQANSTAVCGTSSA